MRPGRAGVWRWAERAAWCLGGALVAVYLAARASGATLAAREVERFAARQAVAAAEEVDTSLWSEGRKLGYEASLAEQGGTALCVLRIPRFGLTVAVLDGNDEITLNRGVGRIPGTARPAELGNIGIAGHRDGFFRVLKDVAPGDVIELESLGRIDSFVVADTAIVQPDDVSLLGPSTEPMLTLVTCYPFYYVGPAPLRFIVRAVPADRLEAARERSTR